MNAINCSIIIIISVVITGLLASFEGAVVNGNPLKIYAQIKDRKLLPKVMKLFQDPSEVINALVVAVNLFSIVIAVFSFVLCKMFFSPLMAGVISTIGTVFLVLLFGEIFPKLISIYFARFVILRLFIFIRIVMFLVSPLVHILNFIVKLLLPRLYKSKKLSSFSRQEVELLFHYQSEDFQSQQLVEMIYRVFAIDKIRVREAKVPINQIMAFPADITVKEFKEELRLKYYQRFPIYHEDIFNIVGYVLTQDILFDENNDAKLLQEYQKEALFTTEIKIVDEVMQMMDQANTYLAFLVDEFGAVSGMVNRKDLSALIIGYFESEKKSGQSMFSMIQNNDTWIVSGRKDIDELNDILHLGLVKNGFETLAGFMMFQLNNIPKLGDRFIYKGFEYVVKEMRGFYCSKIEINPLDESQKED